MSTSTTKIAGEDMTDHHVERYQAEQAAQSMSEPKRGTDAQILFERELTCSAINGAMAFGYQNTNPPPSDDHWLAPFWKVGRKQAEMESALLASKPAALPFGTLKALWKNGSDNRDLLEGSMAHAFALRIFAAQNAATPTTPAQSCGEDAANGAIGEREAFEAWWNANQTWPVAAKNLAFLAWNTRSSLTAEKVAAQPVPVEVWHGERKVTIYPDCVLRVWGTNIESEMSDAPRSLQTVQDAMDWLYAAPQPAQSPDGRTIDKAMVKRLAVQHGLLPVQTERALTDEHLSDLQEAREILENMVRSVELDGNYSTEATCTFLRQALLCLPAAQPESGVDRAD